MRSTRATAAVARLKVRTGSENFSMVRGAEELFHLTLIDASGVVVRLNDPLDLDGFVRFVDSYGPQKPRRVTKMDTAFEKQLAKKN